LIDTNTGASHVMTSDSVQLDLVCGSALEVILVQHKYVPRVLPCCDASMCAVRCVRQFQIIARNKSRQTQALTPKVLCVSTEPKPAAIDHFTAQYHRTRRGASKVSGATALAGAAAPRTRRI
jgi:hypothetical protein